MLQSPVSSHRLKLLLKDPDLEESDQLFRHCLKVLRVDERKRQLERAPFDWHVWVLQALEDGGPVTLHSRAVERHCPQKRVEGDVANVLVTVQKKPKTDRRIFCVKIII